MTRKFFDWHPELNVLSDKSKLFPAIRNMENFLKKVGFVDTDNVAEYVLVSTTGFDPEAAPVKAPWPITWLEYVLPKTYKDPEFDKMVQNIPGGFHVGAYVISQPVPEGGRRDALREDYGLRLLTHLDEESFSALDLEEYHQSSGRGAYMKGLAKKHECETVQLLFLFVGDRYSFEREAFFAIYLDKRGYVIEDSSFMSAETPKFCNALSSPFMVSLGLLNCKNVETRNLACSKTRAKKLRKVGSPPIIYKTLVIHPNGPRYKGNGAETGDKRSWHMCRGHFKTFTEEAPLFGRITGTYWWNSQVRGSKDVGEVHKDYKIERE